MPKKIRELKAILRKAGFKCDQAKGSHSKWKHPKGTRTVVLSGNDGRDARSYQEEDVQKALDEVQRTN